MSLLVTGGFSNRNALLYYFKKRSDNSSLPTVNICSDGKLILKKNDLFKEGHEHEGTKFEFEFVKPSSAECYLDSGFYLKDLYQLAKVKGWQLCPPELAVKIIGNEQHRIDLQKLIKNKKIPKDQSIFIAMDPLPIPNIPNVKAVFTIGLQKGPNLSVSHVNPGSKIYNNDQVWMFVKSKSTL